jgi:hypothetical protein
MSHPRGDRPGIRYARRMSRRSSVFVASLFAVGAAACSTPAKQEVGSTVTAGEPAQKVIVPGGELEPGAAPRMAMNPPGAGGAAVGGASDSLTLKPDEGRISIEVPSQVTAGSEVIAKVLVTPAGVYKINQEFPTKLTLESPAGVTLAKAQLTAGGHDKAKGDADAFEDKQLAFTVKLTPTSGNHTINGTFKFAVCDKDTCLAKKEQISIAVAAN